MHSHSLPLLAVLWLPATLFLLGRLTALGARRGWPSAAALVNGWHSTDAFTRAALILMAAAAAVHLALIPDHARDRLTGALFALDALGLAVVGTAGLLGFRLWRGAAITLLLGAVGAYAVYLALGREVLDLTGVLTKVDELAGVELLTIGWLRQAQRLRHMRPSAALRHRRVAAELGHPD